MKKFKLVLCAFLILLQRTGIQKKHSKIFIYLKANSPQLMSIPDLLFQSVKYNKVFEKYMQDTEREQRLLENFISNNKCVNILDVGCGIAGYHYSWRKKSIDSKINLYLFDSSHFNLSSLKYGMGSENRYYNSLSLAKFFLEYLAKSKSEIKLLEVKKTDKFPEKFDLIVSFLSWGYHYPIETYWDKCINSLNPGGQVIIDIRKGSTSESFIKSLQEYDVDLISEDRGYLTYLIQIR